MGKILQFPLSRVPDDGLDVSLELKTDDLEEVWFKASDLELTGRLEKTDSGEARFQGRLRGRVVLECSLGLAEFSHSFDEALEVHFSRQEQGFGGEGEIELAEADMEVARIEDETADLTASVRDQIGLAIPMQPKCPEKCLGEDPDACRRLDEGKSLGVGAEADPRWEALRGWRP